MIGIYILRCNRHFPEPAYIEEFEGGTEPQHRSVYNGREDSSAGSTYTLPLVSKVWQDV
ncbi:MAG: palindromic element RPE1 domain-containing protein [Rickettsia endosymbiont of Haemaphysalis japonica]